MKEVAEGTGAEKVEEEEELKKLEEERKEAGAGFGYTGSNTVEEVVAEAVLKVVAVEVDTKKEEEEEHNQEADNFAAAECRRRKIHRSPNSERTETAVAVEEGSDSAAAVAEERNSTETVVGMAYTKPWYTHLWWTLRHSTAK